MKKLDLIMLITGLVSLVLSIILTVVLIFVFSAAVKAEVESGKVEETFESIGQYFEDNFHAGKVVVDGETIVDFSEGIHVESDDSIVDIGTDGIHVIDPDTEVNVSFDGISVSSSEG